MAAGQAPTEPFFSVVTPVYNPPAPVLEAMLASVRNQSFANWEHCLVDDGSSEPHVRKILDRASRDDSRVRVFYRESNGGIVAASNDALQRATGEFVALLDHDDELDPEALRLAHETLVADPEVDYLYTDEDLIDETGRCFNPFLKPDWSPERMRTQMYTCHLSIHRRRLALEVGGFDAAFDGSQDWDLVFKVTEKARKVAHIRQVLYHWRMVAGSTALEGIDAKPWAFAAGTRAIQAHCDRVGFPATAEHDDVLFGIYHLRPRLETRPLVSIIIPTAGRPREVWGEQRVLVSHCVQSILAKSTYDNYELICVVDHSMDPTVLAGLQAMAGERLRIVHSTQPFNFAERINLGALAASGDHLLLLNDDMEVITPDWIERLVMYSSFPGIGAVGGKLLLSDGRIQHVGVMFQQGWPGHIYRGFAREFGGYRGNTLVAGNLLAVTGACIMSSREAFESVGGFSTLFPLNYNDVDYCLKLNAEGQRVVLDPDTVLYHFESSSRASDVRPWENDLLHRRWGAWVNPDPYSSPGILPSVDLVPVQAVSAG
ncbi:MAG TPA: glycosyltransferase [Acidimicrobiales bacterium]